MRATTTRRRDSRRLRVLPRRGETDAGAAERWGSKNTVGVKTLGSPPPKDVFAAQPVTAGETSVSRPTGGGGRRPPHTVVRGRRVASQRANALSAVSKRESC
jgi:hypothetical protein